MSDVKAILKKNQYDEGPIGLAKKPGDAAIPEIIKIARDWKLADAACRALAEYPKKTLEEKIHPPLAKLVAQLLCDEDKAFALERIVWFVARQCKTSPKLIGLVCDAVRLVVKKVKCDRFFGYFAMLTRTPDAIALAAQLPDVPFWLPLVLLSPALGPSAVKLVESWNTEGPGEAIVLLKLDLGPLRKKAKDGFESAAAALALAGDPADAALFK
jgi:hypothetical protein